MSNHEHSYSAIDSREICGIKVVIGHNPNSKLPYACWYSIGDKKARAIQRCETKEAAYDLMEARYTSTVALRTYGDQHFRGQR